MSSRPSGPTHKSALDHLQELANENRDLSLQEIRDRLSAESYSLAVILWTLPFLQPIPLPGLSTPLGGLIALTQILAFLRMNLWIPGFLLKKSFSREQIQIIYEKAQLTTRKLEPLRRWNSKWPGIRLPRTIDRWVIFFCGLLLALPLPIPFTNSLPAWSILILSFAEIEDLVLLKLVGYLAFAGTLLYFVLIFETTHKVLAEIFQRLILFF